MASITISFSPTSFSRTFGGSPYLLTTYVDAESAAIVSFDQLSVSPVGSGLTVSVSSSSTSSKNIIFSADTSDYNTTRSFTLTYRIVIDDSGQQSIKTGTETFSLRIVNADPTYTAPVLISSPKVITGNPIQLIRLPGTVTGGTMYYAVTDTNTAPTISGGTWYSDYTQITRTTVGTYYIWYYVSGDPGYNDVNPTSAGSVVLKSQSSQSWTISPTSVSMYPELTTYAYTSGTLVGSVSVSTSNSTIASATYSSLNGTLTITSGIREGTATITLTASGDSEYGPLSRTVTVYNYKETAPWTASINPSSVYEGRSSFIEFDTTTGISAIGTPVAYIHGTSTVTSNITFGTPSLEYGRIVVYTHASSAGTYDIYVSTTGTSRYNNKDQLIQNFVVSALPTPTYSEPGYSNSQGGTSYGFVYDGSSKSIVGTLGTVDSSQGTMYYKMETSYSTTPDPSDLTQWSTSPLLRNLSARDVGNYYGWYYIEGVYPYTNVGPNRFPNASRDGFVVTKADLTYTIIVDYDEVGVGSTINLTLSNSIGYSDPVVTCTDPNVIITQYPDSWHITSTVVGEYTINVSVTPDGNHNPRQQTQVVKFVALIPTYSIDPVAADDITYDGQEHRCLKVRGASNEGIVYYNVTTTNSPPAATDPGWKPVIEVTNVQDAGNYYIWSFIRGTSTGYGDSPIIAISGSPFIISKATPTWTLSISPQTINQYGTSTISISGGYGTEWGTAQCVVDPTYSSYFRILQSLTTPTNFKITSLQPYGGDYTFAVRTLESTNYVEKILTIVLTITGIPSGWKMVTVHVSDQDDSQPVAATPYINVGTEENPIWEELHAYIYDP